METIYPDRNLYDWDEELGFSVWSLPCGRWFYADTLIQARANRSEAERVHYQHAQKQED